MDPTVPQTSMPRLTAEDISENSQSTPDIVVRSASYNDVEPLRDLYRHEAHCQIIHDSALGRGIADPYLFVADGRVAGYAGVWNRYYPGRVLEFYVLPFYLGSTLAFFEELLTVSGATGIEAQTNIAMMQALLLRFGAEINEEKFLFADAAVTDLPCPGGVFRRTTPEDALEDAWCIDVDGVIVASGGFLCHYNPPYGDIYMSVAVEYRGRGFGSYLVQELKRVCYEAGRRSAARCDPGNTASDKTLRKAGFGRCGSLYAAAIRNDG